MAERTLILTPNCGQAPQMRSPAKPAPSPDAHGTTYGEAVLVAPHIRQSEVLIRSQVARCRGGTRICVRADGTSPGHADDGPQPADGVTS